MQLSALEQKVTEQLQLTYTNTPTKTIMQHVFSWPKRSWY